MNCRTVLCALLLGGALSGCLAVSSQKTSPPSPGTGPGPHKEVLAPSPAPLPVFSPAVRTGNLVFLSGQIGNLPGTLNLAPGGITGEAEQALVNIRTLLEQIGLGMKDVVKCTVMLADIEEYAAFNEVYRRHFPEEPPARSALAAGGLVFGARVEVECIAAIH